MCFGGSSKSNSTSYSTPQSLNLGSPSLGGSSTGLEIGDAPNLQTATFYLTAPTQSPLQGLMSGSALTYVLLIGGCYLAYKALK